MNMDWSFFLGKIQVRTVQVSSLYIMCMAKLLNQAGV